MGPLHAGRFAEPVVSDRDEILQSMLLAASEFLLDAQLFLVAGDELRGHLVLGHDGPERSDSRLRRLPLASLSVLCRSVHDRIPYLGPVPETDPCALLCDPALLRRGLVAAPLLLGSRVVCLLVGHPRRLDRALRRSVMEIVEEAAVELGKLIAATREEATPPPAEAEAEVFLLERRKPAPAPSAPAPALLAREPAAPLRAAPEPAVLAAPEPSVARTASEAGAAASELSAAEPAVARAASEAAREAPAETRAAPAPTPGAAARARAVTVEGPDRRRYPRFPLRVEVTHASEHNFFTGFMEDLSEGGLFIATFHLCEIGHRFELEFTIPGREQPILVTCQVRWVRCYNPDGDGFPGMGVEFLRIDEEARTAIQRFIRERQPIFYD